MMLDNDSINYPFIFDTGASNMFFEHFPLIDKFNRIGSSLSKGSDGHFLINPIKESPITKLANIEFYQLSFKTVAMEWSCLDNIYGIIGKEAIRHFSWQIDFENQLIFVSKNINELNVSENAYKIPLTENRFSHHLYLKIKTTYGNSRSFFFDTGSNGGLLLDLDSDKFENSISKRINVIGKQSKGIGGYSKNNEYLVKFDSLYFSDNVCLNNVWAKSSESGIDAIGLDILNQFKITFNWDDKILYLEQMTDSLNLTESRFGFTTKFEDGNIFVSSVLEKSNAFEQGIRPEQKIISIDGMRYNSEDEYCGLQISEIDSIELIIQNSDKQEFNVKCFKELYNSIATDL